MNDQLSRPPQSNKPSSSAGSNRLKAMLDGPVLPLLLRMATPSALAFFLQAFVSMAEIAFVSRLGTTSLAALALVFPGLMLMQMLANGAIGGSVASSVARALGAGDRDRADNLLWHAIVIAMVAGGTFFALFALFGESLLVATGVSAVVITEALTYGSWLFAGSAVIWLMALLSSVYRGMGDMQTPALVMGLGALIQVPLAGTLILGWFGIPPMGLQGAVVALLVVSVLSSLVLLFGLISQRTQLTPRFAAARLQLALFADIFAVGAVASFSPLLTVAIVFVTNMLIGDIGDSALAGFGIVSRVEFLLIPLVFGIGAALTALVGTNVGAGQYRRAVRIAWIGSGVAAAFTGVVGLILAMAPGLLLRWFTNDPMVWQAGERYLVIVGPAFAFQGLGFALYFAAQGGGNVMLPVAGAFLRFLIAAVAGYVGARYFGMGLDYLFICLALGMVAYGLVAMTSLTIGWGARARNEARA